MKKFLRNSRNKVKEMLWKSRYKRYKKICDKKGQREFLIFNTPIHGNLGDHAIIYAEIEMLKELNIEPFEIPTFEEQYIFNYIEKNVDKDADIAITGGGFIGSQWMAEMNLVNKVVETFFEHKIIIFPQTIFFKDDDEGKVELEKSIKNFKKVKNLNIFLREEKSYVFAKKNYENANVFLVPDVVLYLKCLYEYERKNALLCFRKDVEGVLNTEKKEEIKEMLLAQKVEIVETDTVLEKCVKIKERKKELFVKVEDFAKAKIVITDRLHGMIFSAITNTPCITFSNYNHKIKGVYTWLNHNNIIYKENTENLELDIKKICEKTANDLSVYNFEELKRILGE